MYVALVCRNQLDIPLDVSASRRGGSMKTQRDLEGQGPVVGGNVKI